MKYKNLERPSSMREHKKEEKQTWESHQHRENLRHKIRKRWKGSQHKIQREHLQVYTQKQIESTRALLKIYFMSSISWHHLHTLFMITYIWDPMQLFFCQKTPTILKLCWKHQLTLKLSLYFQNWELHLKINFQRLKK